ncbi:hypothetical protein G9A89_000470, partial [Geosiphon pyriformis]
MDELLSVVFSLSDGKTAGLSSILNKLWKHSGFAIGSVIKDALKKNREVWLVLQDMRKAYNS